MKKLLPVIIISLLGAKGHTTGNLPLIKTVFVMVFENNLWSDFKGNVNVPCINLMLLPKASYCQQYYNPPGLHPSLPNYIWLEAGTNFGILNGGAPSVNHQSTADHLVTLLKDAGISWKTYQEDIEGTYVPLTNAYPYAVRHNAFVYFDDITGTNDPNDAYGIAHIRPYSELAADLANDTVARYNFITPNLCHDGHDSCAPQYHPIQQTDQWLASEVPKILNSAAYSNNGALFITWDEGPGGSDGPIGMIVLSPLARGGGYFNNTHYTHSSALRTFQEIFGVTPLLGDAANATNLEDLFSQFSISKAVRLPAGEFELTVSGVIPNKTNLVQTSTNLDAWISISTNVTSTNNFTIVDFAAPDFDQRFYRVIQLP